MYLYQTNVELLMLMQQKLRNETLCYSQPIMIFLWVVLTVKPLDDPLDLVKTLNLRAGELSGRVHLLVSGKPCGNLTVSINIANCLKAQMLLRIQLPH